MGGKVGWQAYQAYEHKVSLDNQAKTRFLPACLSFGLGYSHLASVADAKNLVVPNFIQS